MNIYLLGIHVIFGVLSTVFPVFSTLWIAAFFAYTIFRLQKYSNSDGWAHKASAYIVGVEVLLRASSASLPYEFGKYCVSLFLVLGLVVEKQRKNKLNLIFYLYMGLLIPSILMLDSMDFTILRKMVSYNLSGPLCLSISGLYMYHRVFRKIDFIELIYFFILTLVSHIAFNSIKTPKLSEITFNLSANVDTSGGFGPNQVATVFGFGFGLIGLFWILKVKLTKFKILDQLIGFFFLGFAIFTFSRGGVLVPLIGLLFCLIIQSFGTKNFSQLFSTLRTFFLIIVSGLVIYFIVNNITHDYLSRRYEKTFNKRAQKSTFNEETGVNIDLSGREDIFLDELVIFYRNPILGIGPGASRGYKIDVNRYAFTAHTELSRLLAEHGFYGLIDLIILLVLPFRKYRTEVYLDSKMIIVFFVVMAIGTMLHSAMRLSLPGFTYGLIFIDYQYFQNPLIKSSE
ncbi:MAG: O-antigen ligase family protein [Bacteroidetes bacterium]|nr:O-antigen ligase family protein [Bacteroidota bacterium]